MKLKYDIFSGVPHARQTIALKKAVLGFIIPPVAFWSIGQKVGAICASKVAMRYSAVSSGAVRKAWHSAWPMDSAAAAMWRVS